MSREDEKWGLCVKGIAARTKAIVRCAIVRSTRTAQRESCLRTVNSSLSTKTSSSGEPPRTPSASGVVKKDLHSKVLTSQKGAKDSSSYCESCDTPPVFPNTTSKHLPQPPPLPPRILQYIRFGSTAFATTLLRQSPRARFRCCFARLQIAAGPSTSPAHEDPQPLEAGLAVAHMFWRADAAMSSEGWRYWSDKWEGVVVSGVVREDASHRIGTFDATLIAPQALSFTVSYKRLESSMLSKQSGIKPRATSYATNPNSTHRLIEKPC